MGGSAYGDLLGDLCPGGREPLSMETCLIEQRNRQGYKREHENVGLSNQILCCTGFTAHDDE